jgi:hypothetical protein
MKFFSRDYRNVWIVSERGREARDNGYHFFAYLSRRHPEINAWYVVDYDLPDYERVASLGRTVRYKSWKHYMLCAVSRMKVSTHIMGFTPDIEKYYMLDKVNLIHGKKAFLQHGIIKEDIAWYHYPNVKPDLFICSIPKEAEFVQEVFQYPKGVVQCTGLCRFDALPRKAQTKRQILVMPTWRKYAVEGKTMEEFTASEYYQAYQALLDDERLQKLLEQYDYRLLFYPHYEVQKFISAFHTGSERMEIGVLGYYDVQQLLIESRILISDFSSVHFDFAYMEKAVLYYQFDQAEYHSGHYEKGYFDWERDGFGEVAQDKETLIGALSRLLERDGQLMESDRQRIHDFFPVLDDQNCERNYQAIKKLIRKS